MTSRTQLLVNVPVIPNRPQSLSRTRKTRLFAGLLTAALSLGSYGCDNRSPTPATQNQAPAQAKAPAQDCKGGINGHGGGAAEDPSPGCGGDHALLPGGDFKVPIGESPARGSAQAKVTIVAFSDFQCPFCQRAEQTLAQMSKQYGDEVRVVFKHRPLPFHDRALPAALATEAAAEQGKFWEMHDALLSEPTQLSDADLERKAESIGLDVGRWRAAYRNERLKSRVDADIKLGDQLGVRGTPSFFINGHPIIGAQPPAAFTKVIDEQLERATALLKTGVPRAHLYEALTKDGAEHAAPTPSSPSSGDQPGRGEVMKVEIGDSPVLGAADSLVTIVAFSDFECPFCSRADATLTRIAEEYKGVVRLVWKDMPLPFHRHALNAALAAREAKAQGKFWAMQKKLLAGQQALEREDLERYASEIGLDMGRFKAALDSRSGKSGVDEDAALAAQVGVRGTPAFFVNGTLLTGAQPYQVFKARIDEEVKKAEALVAQGVARNRIYDTLMRTAKPTVPAGP